MDPPPPNNPTILLFSSLPLPCCRPSSVVTKKLSHVIPLLSDYLVTYLVELGMSREARPFFTASISTN